MRSKFFKVCLRYYIFFFFLFSFKNYGQSITSFTTFGTFDQYVPVLLSNVNQNGIKEISIYRNFIHEDRNWLAHGTVTIHSIGFGWGSAGNSIKLENFTHGVENPDNSGLIISPIGRVVCDWSNNNVVVFLRGGTTYRTDATVIQNNGVYQDVAKQQNFTSVSIKDPLYNIPKGIYYSDFDINAKNSLFCALGNGNVGIGTVSPTAKFEVIGDVRASQAIFTSTIANGAVFPSPPETNDSCVVLSAGSALGTGPGYKKTRMLNFFDFPSKIAGDNKGATAFFNIIDRNDMDRFRMIGTAGMDGTFLMYNKKQEEVFKVFEDGNDNTSLEMEKSNSKVIIGGNSSNPKAQNVKLFVNSGNSRFDGGVFIDANLGIGTITPSAKLEIFGNMETATNMILSANYPDKYRWRFITADRGNAIDLDFTSSDVGDVQESVLKLSRSNSGRPEFQLYNNAIVANNGAVGIGTVEPQGKFHVGDNAKSGVIIDNRIGSVISQIPAQIAWAESGNLGSAGDLIISPRTDVSCSLKVFTNDGTNISERFRISGKGDAALQGKFEAKEIKVTITPTADFVFDEKYNLPTLEVVEKHIKEKKHLPEIASAKEMEKEGVNLGDFQIKLLQKIEELTLYVIEQNKKIKELESQVKNK
uniref:hypothetical protein n=1 Tax=Flavobacterium oreochromis TaxID=2906078 RepID=UPI0035AECCFC